MLLGLVFVDPGSIVKSQHILMAADVMMINYMSQYIIFEMLFYWREGTLNWRSICQQSLESHIMGLASPTQENLLTQSNGPRHGLHIPAEFESFNHQSQDAT